MTHFKNWLACFSIILVSVLVACSNLSENRTGQSTSSTMSQPTSSSSVHTTETTSYQIEERSIQSGENELYGQLYLPEANQEKVPLVIFSHELGNTHQTGVLYAEWLASRGIATYIFDYAGGSTSSKSEGSTLDMSVMTEVSDLESVLTTAREWDGIDTDRIVLLGASQGGVVSAITASRNSQEVAGLILLYPAFIIHDTIHANFDSLEQVQEENNFLTWFTTGREYIEDMWNYDVYSEIGHFKDPVLILHGDQDTLVPLSYSERADEIYEDSELIIVEGAGHSFRDDNFGTAIHHIEIYLKNIGILN